MKATHKDKPDAHSSNLPQCVSAVSDDVGSGDEGGGLGGEEEGEAIELVDVAETAHGSAGLPEGLLLLEGGDAVEGSVHVAGRDHVWGGLLASICTLGYWSKLTDADLVGGPLGSKRLSKVRNTSLRGIVATLALGPVDDMARHRSNENDGSTLSTADHGLAGRLGAEESASQVDVNQPAEHANVVVLGIDVGASAGLAGVAVQPWGLDSLGNTSRTDEDINVAKILLNLHLVSIVSIETIVGNIRQSWPPKPRLHHEHPPYKTAQELRTA